MKLAHTFGAPAAAVAALLAAGCLGLGTTGASGCLSSVPTRSYTVGDTASDSLTGNICKILFQFTASAQTNVRVTLTSPSFQTFLQLYDQRGAIVMNSAYTDALDTVTTVRLMLGTGSYALAVNAVNGGQSGAFRLVTATDSAAVSGCKAIWATPGITTTQAITASDCTQGPAGTSHFSHVYDIVLLSGQEGVFAESSAAFPPAMVLTGQGANVTSVLDSLSSVASLSATAVTQGVYTLWVGTSGAGQTGSYTVGIK